MIFSLWERGKLKKQKAQEEKKTKQTNQRGWSKYDEKLHGVGEIEGEKERLCWVRTNISSELMHIVKRIDFLLLFVGGHHSGMEYSKNCIAYY